jgi:CheY-like chemotaxis protein
MPNGGKLTISTTNRTIGAAEVRQHSYPVAPGEYVVVSVEDTGCGMDPKTLAHAFEPFFSTKGEAGTGLGLATVYGIIKQSGGYIWAESAVGGGTTFHVYLPRAEQKAAEASAVSEPASSSVGAAGAAGTILVVEDEDGVRELVTRILSKAGYAVLKACDGEDGLRVAAEHRGAIDLVLTDVVMPRMSGRELVEQLKKFRPSVPVLFMSGYTDDALVHHGVRSSEAHFLQKPVEPRALLNTIAILLDQAGTDTKAQLSRLS